MTLSFFKYFALSLLACAISLLISLAFSTSGFPPLSAIARDYSSPMAFLAMFSAIFAAIENA